MNFCTWTVNDNDYKCRLNARNCIELEKKLGTNPLNIFTKVAQNQTMPDLNVLLTILHSSLQSLEHGISIDKVYDLFDKYVDEGHSSIDLIPLIMDIFKVSGFIGEETEEKN